MSLSNQAMESLLQAIDIIADKRAKENTAYNQTIICYIIDNSHAEKQGYYTVSNDTLTFDAYSDNPSYKVGAYVRVTIPNGDYSQQKYIEGLYAYNGGEALTYVSPLDTFLDAADLIDQRASTNTLVSGAIGLAANNVRTTAIPIWDIKLSDDPSYQKLQANGIYDTLGLQADFKCLLGNYDMRSGSYGLRLDLNVKLNENTEFSVIHSIYLDSSTMFGNPYNFSVFTTQAQTYDISTIGTITGATLYLYQNNDFTYYDKEIKDIKSDTSNIFVSNLYIAFGSDLYKVPDNTLKLYTKDSLSYKYNDYSEATNKKAMSLLWYNKNEYDQYVGFGDGVYDVDYDEIKYLEEMKINNRRLSQQGNEDEIPNTKEGLDVSANINDAIPLLKDIKSFIDSKLIRNLSSFKRRLFGCDDGEKVVGDWIDQIDDISSIFPEQMDGLAAAVKNLLKKNGVAESNYSKEILNGLNSIFTLESTIKLPNEASGVILSGSEKEGWVFAPGILTLTEHGYSSYRGIYDSFQIIMLPLFNELKIKYDKLNSLILDIEIKAQSARNGVPFIPMDDSKYANRYAIYWYRYNPAYYNETEPFMEAGWEPLKRDEHIGRPKTENPDNTGFLVKKCDDSNNVLYLNLDPYCKTEKFRVVLCYNHEVYFSNILEFTNEDVVPDDNELYKVDALYLEHGAQSHATYQTFYASNYGLANMGEASRDRAIKLSCKEEYGGDKVLAGAQVYWYIPNTTTMLTYNEESLVTKMGFIAMNPTKELSGGSEYCRDGYICFYKTIPAFPEDELDIEAWKENLNFYYRIKDYFVPTSLRNTILCHIVSNGLNIEVELPITFGTLGSSGTDYTLIVMPATSQKCVSTEVNEDGQIKSGDLLLTVALYDYDNNLIAFANDDKLQLKWIGPTSYNDPVGPSISADGTAEIIIPAIGAVGSHTGILQVTYPMTIESTAEVEDAGFSKKRIVDISTQYPISWGLRDGASPTNETYYIEGATTIIYDAMGTNPVYYKNPYKIYDSSHQQIPISGWTIKWYDKDGQMVLADSPEYNFCKNYLPSMTKIYTLAPCNMYIHNCEYYPVVEAFDGNGCIWAQPIVILQNRYPSAMLNSWDGELTIDEKNGTILSTMVGAGKKEADNSFSGVLMGDVKLADTETNSETYNRLYSGHSGLGLYGFHHGAQSFGFNVDGTAFIGKSGGGRISFDGNYGFLYSANWLESFKTEKYDENGNLELDKNGLPIIYYNNPFIKDDNGTVSLSTGKAGMAIDLQSGHIDAYDFKLTSDGVRLDADSEGTGYYFDIGKTDGKYYVRFKKDGSLELSISNGTLLADENMTLIDYITTHDQSLKNDFDATIKDIKDNVIGEVPDSLSPGTIYDNLTAEIDRIENEVIGGDPNNPISNSVYSYINAIEYLDDENIFNKLTNYGGYEGIFKDKDGKLYLNGSYIATGILRSKNWMGKLTYHSPAGNAITYGTYEDAKLAVEKGEATWNGNWSLTAAAGTYWNLNDGQLWANNFELNAWKDLTYNSDSNVVSTSAKAGGLYLNSNPDSDGMYLSIGCTSEQTLEDGSIIQPHFIQYSGKGDLVARLKSFTLDALENTDHSGLYLKSDPDESDEDYYLRLGDSDGFIQFNGNKKLSIGLKDFVLDAWSDGTEVNQNGQISLGETGGIYLNSNPTTETDDKGRAKGHYFSVGKEDGYIQLDALGNLSLQAKNFILDAWDNNTGGIYLNSNPINDEDYYFSIGDTSENWMQFNKVGSFTIALNGEKSSFLLNAWNNSSGLYLNSNPINDEDYYFSAGNGDNFIQLSPKDGLSIKSNTFELDAWNDTEKNGIGLSSLGNSHYLTAGNGENFIQLTKDDLVIKTNDLRLDAWDETNGGIQLLSDPDAVGGSYYFKVGSTAYNLAFDKDGNLILNINDIYGLDILDNSSNNSLNQYITSLVSADTALQNAVDRINTAVSEKLNITDLTSNRIWWTLTAGGKLQGGVFDDNGNYYINASVIATGVLKSANVTVKELSDGNYSLEVDKDKTGVYIDLNKGLLWANTFDLLVQPTYAEFMQGKAAIILTNDPKVKTNDEATTNQAYYLFIGNNKGYLSFDDKYNLTVSGTVNASAGNIGGWEITSSSLVAPNKNLYIGPDMIFGGMAVLEELKFLAVGKYDINISGEVTNYETNEATHYNFAYKIMTEEAFTVKVQGEAGFLLMDAIPSANRDYSAIPLGPDAENKVNIEKNNLGKILLISRTTVSPFSTTSGFILTPTGKLYASGVDLSGYITATGGKIGGWTIGTSTLSADGIVLKATTTNDKYDTKVINIYGETFYVRKDGYMYSSSGKIGGWTIDTEQLKSGSGSSYVALNSSSDSSYAIWAGSTTNSLAPFSVTKAGALKSTNATITGSITATAGSIGGWTIKNSCTIKEPTLGTTLYLGPALYAQEYTSQEQGKITDPQDPNSSIEVEVKYRTFFTPKGVIMEYQYFSGQNKNYQEGEKIGNPWYKDCRWTEMTKYVSPLKSN